MKQKKIINTMILLNKQMNHLILRALASADRGETLMTKVLGTQYVEGFHSH